MGILIKEVEVELESLSPLLMDKFDMEPPICKTSDDYKRAAENKVYKDDNGLFIPGAAIKACVREASSELGKKMESKKNRQMIKAGVFIKNLYLNKKKHDGIQADVVARGKGDKLTRVITYRPIIDKWEGKFRANLIGVEPKYLEQALTLGGIKYGLLGYRPEYGRFIVKKMIEIK